MEIITGKQSGPRRILIHGMRGVGKSTFAAGAPVPIFVQSDDGAGDIACDKYPVAKNYNEIMDCLTQLYMEDYKKYRTVVLDEIDVLEEKILWPHVLSEYRCKGNEQPPRHISEIGWQEGYKTALMYWRKILDALSALRNNRGMTVILTAPTEIDKFKDPEAETYNRYVPSLHSASSQMIRGWCDEVLFATFKIFSEKLKEGFGVTRNLPNSPGTRVLYTEYRPTHEAKNRLRLPYEIPFPIDSWAEFKKYLPEQKEPINEDDLKM